MNWVGVDPPRPKDAPLGATMTDGPNAVGFDYFYGFTHTRSIGSIIEQDRVVAHVEPVENQPLMIKKAVEWISQRTAGEPFFLYLPLCPPHTPVVPSPEFVGKSGAKDVVKQDPRYGDWVYQGDAMLGQIMEVLEQNSLAENTLLIATADNGAAGRSYAPLRAQKTSIYEGGHRVPFVARWPGKVQPNSQWDRTICLNDLMATTAEIVGAEIPAGAAEDSVSIVPALLGTSAAPTREATIHQSMGRDLAIRQGPWKAIYHRDGKRELFNLVDDLSETTNVLPNNPDVGAKLTDLFQEYIDRGRSTPGDPQAAEHRLTLDRSAPSAKSKKLSRKSRKNK